MVSGKKVIDMSNGAAKYRDQQSNMSFQRKDIIGGGSGRNDGRSQNGNSSSFRTDSAISGSRNQGERVLQRWVPDAPEDTDGSLESSRMQPSTGAAWDQFAENERRFGVTTDYDENLYTTTIDKSHPQYKQRLAEADKKAREIERSAVTNSHVAEERITDNLTGEDNGADEEDRYSGVRRQDFPPLTSSNNNKYTPPARRPPTGQSTVSGAPVDPAIISSQLARPDKPVVEKSKVTPITKVLKVETDTTPPSKESSLTATPDSKPTTSVSASSTSRTTTSPPVGPPNATATVERDVASAFKGFAAQQRRNVEQVRSAKMKNDKEIKLNDLKKFADSFKLHTPVPTDLVSIIAKDPAKQKEIQEKAKRNAEEAKANNAPEISKPTIPATDTKPVVRPLPATHGTSPSSIPSRQNPNRTTGFQGQYNSQSFRGDRPSQVQPTTPAQQQNRQPGNLGARLRHLEQPKPGQLPINPSSHESRQPPTGPANPVDPNFSRRSSGVTSAQGARLNPNSSEFRPSPHAATFNPNGNPSSGSSPRSAITHAEQAVTPPVVRPLLRRKPIPESERPSLKGKFNTLEYIKSLKPAPEKNWKANGGLKPAYDTTPAWRLPSDEDGVDCTIHLTYSKLFDLTPFPPQTMSPPNPPHAVPQVPHQHQLPFHLQQGVGVHGMASRGSPRQPQMNIHANQHGHGPNQAFNSDDHHRMMSSHSAQSYAASPRLQNVPMSFPSPMPQPAQLAYNPPMIPYPGAPPMQQYRSLSQSQQFIPQQTHMGPAFMMQTPGNGFMASQGIPPGAQMMYPQGGQGHFMPPSNGHPPAMPGVNGYPSPGRGGAPMMMSQGSQQGHQQPIYPGMNPGMSPGPQYGNVAPVFAPQPPGQIPLRGYGGPNQFGTSPQQMHQFGPQQHRNSHQNGNYNNGKNFQSHGQHPNGVPNNQVPTGPQVRVPDGGEEAK